MYGTAFAMVFFASTLLVRSPQDLIRETAENYRNLDSIEINGHLTTEVPGTPWIFRCIAISAAAGHKFVPPDSPWPSFDSGSQFGRCEYINTRKQGSSSEDQSASGSQEPPNAGWAMPGSWGDYKKLDANVESTHLLGSEMLNVAGEHIPCEIVEVLYKARSGAASNAVRYWISPDKHLVLQEKFAEANVVQHNAVYQWTYTVDAVALNQPPPQWLVDFYERQVGKTRLQWVGRVAPDFALFDLAGTKTVLSALHGKAVLLNFWATWCGPCRVEMPLLEKLRDEYRGKGLKIWGVTDDSTETAQKFLSTHHCSLPTLIDQGRDAFKNYEVQGIPVLVLVGRDGKVAKYWDGLQYEKDVRAALEDALR